MYEETAESDRLLKDVAICAASSHLKELLDRGEFGTLQKMERLDLICSSYHTLGTHMGLDRQMSLFQQAYTARCVILKMSASLRLPLRSWPNAALLIISIAGTTAAVAVSISRHDGDQGLAEVTFGWAGTNRG
jgi:hypothetical protein